VKYAISTSQIVNGKIEYHVIGFVKADSMEDLVTKLDIGDLVRTHFNPRGVSIYFTEIEEIVSGEHLLARMRWL
jgi:hypothetical protein